MANTVNHCRPRRLDIEYWDAVRYNTLILQRLDLELVGQHVQAEVMSEAVEVVRSVQFVTVSKPTSEELTAKLIQVRKRGMLRRRNLTSVSRIFCQQLPEVRTFVFELCCVDVASFLVVANVDCRHR